MKKVKILLIVAIPIILFFSSPIILAELVNLGVIEEYSEIPHWVIRPFYVGEYHDDVVEVEWSNYLDVDHEIIQFMEKGDSYKSAALYDNSHRIDEVYIWAEKKPYAYFLGVNEGYIKVNYVKADDLGNHRIKTSWDLKDFSKEDRRIFKKLENHPELFMKGQIINDDNPVYSGSIKGELELS